MKLYKTITPLNMSTAVALGCFDGVHLAHRKVLEQVINCKDEGLTPAMFTFADYYQKGVTTRIYTQDEKLSELEKIGIEQVICVPFSLVYLMSAEDFVADVLKTAMGAKKVFCGYNYKFGRGGTADVATLKYLCAQHGIEVYVYDEVQLREETVSSTRIRSLLAEGELEFANEMLTKPFAIRGEIVHGQALGRKLGIPTINIEADSTKLLPKYGVYSALVYFDTSETPLRAALNIGIRPTLGGNSPTVEAFLIDSVNGDFYGHMAKAELIKYIRPERKFANLQELQAAIENDVKIIKGE